MRVTSLLLTGLIAQTASAQIEPEIYPDAVRVQALSDTLVRLEMKGPKGFEDRKTFVVQDRFWPGPKKWHVWKTVGGSMGLDIGKFRISVRLPAKSLQDVTVTDDKGKPLYEGPSSAPSAQFFPGPADDWRVFVVADNPRIVPPAWGATPAPAITDHAETSGWDTTNPALDLYVFLNKGGGYRQFVTDYLKLTGKIELPPLFAFGLMDSRYHPYTQDQALEVIDKYRERQFPLDVFVLDTDWRVGASKGYTVNEKLWPDLTTFIKQVHDRGVRTMFNDHPEPKAPTALDPLETQYRWDGLTSVLRLGADAWWYDRNWITHLREPAPGLRAEIWGERVYHDVTQHFRPDRRPMIMSNAQGIDNGVRRYAPQPGFHRYPIHWTGDTDADWPYLKFGIANAVDGGVESLLPFISEDLTGHKGKPSPEFYVRFMQFGCLSPITRLHCTVGQTRFPWDFGVEAEGIVREYVKLRYRLLPTIYSAARRAHDDGTPLLRRCDLEWPQFQEAQDSQQYLLGDDILVAPVNESKDGVPNDVPAGLLHTRDGAPGLLAEYFDNPKAEGTPVLTRIDASVSFDWGSGPPGPKVPRDKFSARWKGVLGPVPETGDYVIGTRTDDGAKLFIDGKFVVSKWVVQDNVTNVKPLRMEKGKSYDVELDYFDDARDAICHFVWIKPSEKKRIARRRLWIPPGTWVDPMTGQRYRGPARLTLDLALSRMPIFVRQGSAVFLAKEVESTSKGVWQAPVLDICPPERDTVFERAMYEDDGLSTRYLRGESARTTVKVRRKGTRLTLDIGPAVGDYAGMPKLRSWTVRINLQGEVEPTNPKIDGVKVADDRVGSPVRPGTSPIRTPFKLDNGWILVVPESSVRKSHRVEVTLKRRSKG